MRVGITGGHGFIGHYVVEELLGSGHEVLAFDHHQHDALHREWPEGVEVFLGDIRDSTAVVEMAAHVDGIVHLAAVLGTAETITNPRPAAETNIMGSLNVFEAASQYQLPVCYAAVGNAWMRSHGVGAYVISKSCAEDFAGMFNKHRDGRIQVVRPMNAYGPRQSVAQPYGWSKVRKITRAFVCETLHGVPIEVYGDGTQVSDMVWVEDVASTFVHGLTLAHQDAVTEEPIEVGPRASKTVNDIAGLVADAAAVITGNRVPLRHLPMRPGEVPNATVAADTSTLEAAGVDPDKFLPVEEGIPQTVRWFHEHEGTHWTVPSA